MWGSVLGAAGAGKVYGGCGRVHVNLQEMQENASSLLCGAAWQAVAGVEGREGRIWVTVEGEPEFLALGVSGHGRAQTGWPVVSIQRARCASTLQLPLDRHWEEGGEQGMISLPVQMDDGQ